MRGLVGRGAGNGDHGRHSIHVRLFRPVVSGRRPRSATRPVFTSRCKSRARAPRASRLASPRRRSAPPPQVIRGRGARQARAQWKAANALVMLSAAARHHCDQHGMRAESAARSEEGLLVDAGLPTRQKTRSRGCCSRVAKEGEGAAYVRAGSASKDYKSRPSPRRCSRYSCRTCRPTIRMLWPARAPPVRATLG
jgi:hypothetical protein